MKRKKIKLIILLKRNYREIIIVFSAFALMVGAAYFSVGTIIRQGLLDRAEEMIFVAEANVRAGLSEAETILLNTYNIVEDMINRNASTQEILDYLARTTEWMRHRDDGLLNYYGVYGLINEEFLDGINPNPDSDYIPQMRPWYQTAIRSGSAIGYTTPYNDWHTGETIVSAVRNLFDKDGKIIGILTIDVEMTWLSKYVISLSESSGGYGILINQNLSILAHPDNEFIGLQFQELGNNYNNISKILNRGEKLHAHRTFDNSGKSVITFFTRIVNGWYIGIVIPYHQFFKDLYYSAVILTILGLVLSLALCYILLRISAAKIRADERNKSKSSFLASMSHEIRTPMNAITGMAELLLRGNLSDEARGYAQDIKQAGNNLISIINDILDISKIEAGKLEIIPCKFNFSSLIKDTINIVQMKIKTKQLNFISDIDSNIPSDLFGDEIRLRQMLLNLLSNAIKYTDKGQINLHVTIDKRDEKNIWLNFTVTDTGRGIKQEDHEKLFDEFVQVDIAKNKNIEGTGLGLAITKKLCVLMGGNISMKSEYGKGSSFTINIPLGVESDTPFTAIDNSEDYDKIKYCYPTARLLIVDDIKTNLKVAEGLLSPYKVIVETCDSGAQAIKLVKRNDYDIVFMDHMMPEMDGIEATEIIREWESQRSINYEFYLNRKKKVTIIALTANAVVGMREMFIEKGFDDFIAKPIEISRLNEILDQWIPKEKKVNITENEKPKTNEDRPTIIIPGIDTEKGIRGTGGKIERYISVLNMFAKDAEKRLPMFQKMPDADTLSLFTTNVHALKSAAASIGAEKVSKDALELEKAGKASDIKFIEDNLNEFAKDIAELLTNIQKAKDLYADQSFQSKENTLDFKQQIKELKESLAANKASSDILKILEKLYKLSLDEKTIQTLENVSYNVLMSEYEEAIKIISSF